MFDIVTVGPDHSDELSRLSSTSFKQAYADVHSAANLQAYCDQHFRAVDLQTQLSDPDTLCRVAYRNAKAVGFCLTKIQASPVQLDGKAIELKQIYVLSSEYGAGTGPALFDDAVERCEASSANWLWLIVSAINDRAQRFYERRDFARIGKGPVLTVGSDQLTSLIMARSLS